MMTIDIDRITARALVEAGYMPLSRYLELFDTHVDQQPTIETSSISPFDLEYLVSSIPDRHDALD